MRTERGLDRLVFFTDAVTAIAITLLILPLVDSVSSESDKFSDLYHFLDAKWPQLGVFALSFVVIARLWIAHHALFEHVKAYSPRLMQVNMFWAFTVVLLPLPTAIIAQFPTTWLSTLFYIGTMTLTSTASTVMASLIRKDPSLMLETNPLGNRQFENFLVTSILFVVALVVGVSAPMLNFLSLLLLLLGSPIVWLLNRRRPSRMSQE